MRIRITRRVKFRLRGCGYGWPLPISYIPVAISRLGPSPSAQIFCSFPHSRSGSVPRIGSSARRRLPLGGVQRRRGSPRFAAASAAPPTFSRQSPRALACVLRAPADDPAYAPPSPLPPLLFPWEPGQLPRVAGPWLRRWFQASCNRIAPLLDTQLHKSDNAATTALSTVLDARSTSLGTMVHLVRSRCHRVKRRENF